MKLNRHAILPAIRANLPAAKTAMHEPIYRWMATLAGLMVIGVSAALVVFIRGLGVTNLTDLVPWGLWISIDLSAIALAAGAFSVSAIAYVMRRKEFRLSLIHI